MTDDLVKRQKQDALYEDEPWAKLAVLAGFRPYDTEASGRSAFRFCAKKIDALTAERDLLRRGIEYVLDGYGLAGPDYRFPDGEVEANWITDHLVSVMKGETP